MLSRDNAPGGENYRCSSTSSLVLGYDYVVYDLSLVSAAKPETLLHPLKTSSDF